LPTFRLDALLLADGKGTWRHRGLARHYMELMLATGVITLFMPARVGPQVLSHFGCITCSACSPCTRYRRPGWRFGVATSTATVAT
jgi:uncharacterized membrane protein